MGCNRCHTLCLGGTKFFGAGIGFVIRSGEIVIVGVLPSSPCRISLRTVSGIAEFFLILSIIDCLSGFVVDGTTTLTFGAAFSFTCGSGGTGGIVFLTTGLGLLTTVDFP